MNAIPAGRAIARLATAFVLGIAAPVFAAPIATPTPASLGFGGQSMGTTSPAQTIQITNTGDAALSIGSVSVSPQFSVANGCPASLAVNASCNLDVRFTPAVAAGAVGSTTNVTGSVTLTTNGTGSPQNVPVSGTSERSLVTYLYRAILRRAPDASGKTFWEGEAVRMSGLGANVNEVWYAMAMFFYNGTEYASFNRDNTGFVTDLYNTFFNRPPDSGGLAFWVAELNAGNTREVLLANFMFSPEFTTFTQGIFGNTAARAEVDMAGDFFRGLLARLPDDGGFSFWIAQFRSAQCAGAAQVNGQIESISASFATSAEYANRARTSKQYVGDLYNAFLRRGGDSTGVTFWVNALNSGTSASSVRQQFIQSPEFQARVTAVVNQGCFANQAALTQAFGPAAIAQGAASTLTFTLANGSGNPAQSGINFTETLPANLVVAAVPALASTCPSGTGVIAAAAGGGTITVTGATMNAAQASCTIAVNVTSSVPGTYNNTAAGNITGATKVTITGVDATLTVSAPPALAKAFGPAAIAPGATSTLMFTLTNGTGNPAESGINFTDTLPANLVVAAAPALASTCPSGTGAISAAAGGGTITVTGATMNAAQASCTMAVNVTSNVPGTYNNTGAGNITGVAKVTTTGVNASLTVSASPPAALTKAFAPASFVQGGTSTLTFTLTNGTGNPAQSGINFTDTLPTNVVVAAAPAFATTCPSGTGVISAAAGSGTITVTGATMSAAQASCTISVAVTSNIPGTYNNTAAGNITGVAKATTTGVNATLTVSATPPAALTKSFAPAAIVQGSTSTLTFTLANGTGNPARSGINFTDTLPVGVVVAATPALASTCPSGTGVISAAAGAGTITVTGATMSVGLVSCTIAVNVTSNAAGTYNNTGVGNITGAAKITTSGVSATLAVSAATPALAKAFAPATIAQGGTATLNFTLTNGTGNPAQAGISFTDTLPANVVVAAAPALATTCPSGTGLISAAAGSSSITVTGATMNSGQASCTISVNVTSNVAGGTYNNTGAGNITGATKVTTAGVSATLTISAQATPTLTKVFAPVSIGQGGIATLTFTLTNRPGNPAQSGINFTDTLPANVTLAAVPALASTCPSGTGLITAAAGTGSISVTAATMNLGQVSCTISVNVTSSVPGTYNNTGAANITGAAKVTTAGVNATLTVLAQPAPTLSKAFSPATILPGGTSTLTFTLTNANGSPSQSGINFTDTLPANVVVAASPALASTCVGGTGVISAAGGAGSITVTSAAMNGGQTSCTIAVNVTAGVVGTYINTDAGNISGVAKIATAGVNATLTASASGTTSLLRVSVGGFGYVTSDVGGLSCGHLPAAASGTSTQCFAQVSGTVMLTATPFNASFQFAGWAGDTTCTNQNPCTIDMSQARWVRAKFTHVTTNGNVCAAMGLVSDKNAHPLNGSFPALSVGQSFTDPDFGTTIRRLTDVKNDGRGAQTFLVPAYSTISAWNADESYLILYRVSGWHELYNGKTYQFIRKLTDLPYVDVEQFYWDTTDPRIIYGADSSANKLYKYDVDAPAGQRTTLLHNFGAQCGTGSLTGGDDPFFDSFDSSKFGFACYAGGALFSYNRVTDTLGTVAPASTPRDNPASAPQISPSGTNMLLPVPKPSGWGSGGSVQRVFDLNMNAGGYIDSQATEHAAMGLNFNGTDSLYGLVFDAGPSGTAEGTVVQWNLQAAPNGLNRIIGRVLVGPNTGYPYPPSGSHVSAHAFHRTGLMAASAIGNTTGAGVLDQELLYIDGDTATNGGSWVCRVGHHRSNSDSEYWAEPHPSISPSGTRVVFGSAWGDSTASYIIPTSWSFLGTSREVPVADDAAVTVGA